MTELKPKPVRCGCGGEAILKHYCYSYGDDDQYYFVWCERCDIQTKTYPTEAEAIEAWNRAMSERTTMVWKPAEGRPAYEKGICSCGYVLSVLQRDFVYCPGCGAKLEWK